MSNPSPATESPRSMPLRSALRDDSERTPPPSGAVKAVQIAEPDVTDVLEPPPPVEEPPLPRKQFPASVARRLSGRAAVVPVSPSVQTPLSSQASQASLEGLASYMAASPAQLPADDPQLPVSPMLRPHAHPLQHQRRHRTVDQITGRLLAQMAEWIQHERAKKEARKARHVRTSHGHGRKTKSPPAGDAKGKARERRHERASEGAPATTRASEDDDNHDHDGGETSEGGADGLAMTSPGRDPAIRRQRAPSTGSASSEVSLDRLQRILDDSVAALGMESLAGYVGSLRIGSGLSGGGGGRRHSRTLRYQPSRTASSDTEYLDGDVLVPSCDALLDNSRTLKYAATAVPSAASDAGSVSGRREEKERQAWLSFKNEIIRLAHTLRLKGWRKVPLDAGETISVERLSGALTNAVYVVSPPAELGGGGGRGGSGGAGRGGGLDPGTATAPLSSGNSSSVSINIGGNAVEDGKRVLPNKLLLRIYGPQVEHLIDREKELSVLRRLARKKIGPRLLGTFANGRFEQFFTATTLTAANLREPDTSRQIAKRMRELHDGVELLEEEKDGGPTVWRNWDRWLDSVEATITFLDDEVRRARQQEPPAGSFMSTWKSRGFVCGVEWPTFKALIDKHRALVKSYYGDPRRLRDRLIFAHNDTQYGNILRLQPDDKSPLLQPENEHKQLIVIDFEYAAANPPCVEFVNHFTEWTYDYHDSVAPHACFHQRYPTPDQQRRFIRAYVDHQPGFPHQSASSTPRFGPTALPPLTPLHEQPPPLSGGVSGGATASAPPALPAHAPPPQGPAPVASSSSSIVDFMLDARAPPGGWVEEERRREELVERQVAELMEETRLWRVANSALWVAWGIVQAKVPGFRLKAEGDGGSGGGSGDDNAAAAGKAAEEGDAAANQEDEFDYLQYAQERAFFVLGDCIQAGLLRMDELPEDVQAKVKIVEY